MTPRRDSGWTFAGFSQTTGTITQSFFNAYFAEYRNYRGYDDGLRTGPYNFGFLNNPSLGNWVEHFPYQDGLLVWYYDTSFADNNVGDNCASGRCGGLFLPVDAHPDLLLRPDNGKVWRPRDPVLRLDVRPGSRRRRSRSMPTASRPQLRRAAREPVVRRHGRATGSRPNPSIGNFGWASVPLPATGTTIRVVSVSAQDSFMQVLVNQK